ncbi:MAG: peptidoglycan-binding protein [Oscillospiraceae bacterium]|jgi:murein L,D-transpeptidase YcbB/YkuD|nr:peptidoglycan-binding protein [Oscillospiraceae bacterium]
MTTIDSSAAICEIQSYLRAIDRFQGGSPTLQVNGVYDDTTCQMVAAFQKSHNLPDSGKMDIETWEAIAGSYQQIMLQNSVPSMLDCFPSSCFLLGKGASGNLVQGMQLVLQFLAEKFHNIPIAPCSGSFEDETEQAVMELQRRCELDPTGVIDLATWNHIASLYNFAAKELFDAKIHQK